MQTDGFNKNIHQQFTTSELFPYGENEHSLELPEHDCCTLYAYDAFGNHSFD